MARRFTALVGLSTHTHLHARVHRECGFMQRYALRRMDNRTFLSLEKTWNFANIYAFTFVQLETALRLTCAWRRCSRWLSAPGGRRCEMGHGNGTCLCSWGSGERYTSGWVATGKHKTETLRCLWLFWGRRMLNMASKQTEALGKK